MALWFRSVFVGLVVCSCGLSFLFFFLPVKGSSRLFEESGGLRRQKHITVGRLPSSNATHLERKCKKKKDLEEVPATF